VGRKNAIPSKRVQKKESKPESTKVVAAGKTDLELDKPDISHHQVSFEGRSYQYAGDCPCAGCESIRRYPHPTMCDWCHENHCGGPEHCNTKKYGTGDDIRGASETSSDTSEGFIEGVCSIVRDRISTITKTIKELSEMTIPRYQDKSTIEDGPTRGKNIGGRSRERQGTGHKYLALSDLSFDKKTAKILGVKVGPGTASWNKDQTVVTCKLSLEGSLRMWTLTVNNPNLEILQNAFGSDENDWTEKKVQLFIEENDWDGKQNIRCAVVEGKKRGK
jgi:hypothetical protein